MKRLNIAYLISAITASLLVGCGSSGNSNSGDSGSQNATGLLGTSATTYGYRLDKYGTLF